MKRVFLDCGTHFGQGLEEIIDILKITDDWIIHTFEANPETYKIFVEEHLGSRKWITHHNKAISDHCGVMTINIEVFDNGDKTGMGSSIVKLDDWNPWQTNHRDQFIQQEIECIDLSKFIFENFEKDDYIVVKMDIEGAEFHVIDHLIETKAIEFINKMFIEWHAEFFTNKKEMRKKQDSLFKQINSYGIKIESWK